MPQHQAPAGTCTKYRVFVLAEKSGMLLARFQPAPATCCQRVPSVRSCLFLPAPACSCLLLHPPTSPRHPQSNCPTRQTAPHALQRPSKPSFNLTTYLKPCRIHPFSRTTSQLPEPHRWNARHATDASPCPRLGHAGTDPRPGASTLSARHVSLSPLLSPLLLFSTLIDGASGRYTRNYRFTMSESSAA